ncbi:hypothetical protein BpHYR1_050914 [Brachionus plicatilis]|uniref:Uncharacterized protein n=1 Tax=Brachionus plicatilis TaxID=10195 RepID=A0A3M7RK31_BRAPC|nr:hypothetical protein BpHYR1_050914 [Brachionus plicatilis]
MIRVQCEIKNLSKKNIKRRAFQNSITRSNSTQWVSLAYSIGLLLMPSWSYLNFNLIVKSLFIKNTENPFKVRFVRLEQYFGMFWVNFLRTKKILIFPQIFSDKLFTNFFLTDKVCLIKCLIIMAINVKFKFSNKIIFDFRI